MDIDIVCCYMGVRGCVYVCLCVFGNGDHFYSSLNFLYFWHKSGHSGIRFVKTSMHVKNLKLTTKITQHIAPKPGEGKNITKTARSIL